MHKTKYAEQINKYVVIMVDNRRLHDCRVCRVCRLEGDAFTGYINGMKAKLSWEELIERRDQLEEALNES